MKSAYPLRESQADQLLTHSGRPLGDITAEAIAAGELRGDDLRTHAEALRKQAAIARAGGYPQLAANLTRAAELTDVPNDELLKIYELLRPERASYDELMRLADYLEATFGARENAAFIKDAAASLSRARICCGADWRGHYDARIFFTTEEKRQHREHRECRGDFVNHPPDGAQHILSGGPRVAPTR